MAEKRSVRFDTPARNRQVITRLFERGVPFSVGKDGTIRYSSRFEEAVDVDVLSPSRCRVFPKWQVLSFPTGWAPVYRDYMRRKRLRFAREWLNGELVYLIPASYRPHTWSLPDPSPTPDEAAYASV